MKKALSSNVRFKEIMMFKKAIAVLFVVMCLSFSGCVTMPLDHPDPKVAGPAEVGGIVGMVAGIPLDIVALPITWPLAAMDDSPDGGGAYIIMAPSIVTGYVVGNVVGFVPWLAFGWWGNEKYESSRPKAYDYIPPHERTTESEQRN